MPITSIKEVAKSDTTVSVIIPAYRSVHTIGRAIESVLAQTFPVDQIIVVDDGSPDGLEAALQKYGHGITLIHKANGGASSARNAGIERACGEWIAFLDADDTWEPEKLNVQLAILKRFPEVGLVAAHYFEQIPGGARTFHETEFVPLDRPVLLSGESAFAAALEVWTGTVLVRRDVLGDLRFDESLRTAEDRDLWIRLVVATHIYFCSQALATAVLEPGSLSRSNIDRDYGNMLSVVKRNRALLGRAGFSKWEAYFYRRWAGCHLGNAEPRAAIRPAWQRIQRQPWSPEAWRIWLKAAILPNRSMHKSTRD